jgi:biotin operon repressor
MNKKNFIDYNFVDPILLQNPELTWTEFNKKYSVKMSDATFYNRKSFLQKKLANESNPLTDQLPDTTKLESPSKETLSSLVQAEKLPKQGSLMHKTLELLTIHKEVGISIDELMSQLKVERTSIYYLIHHLKKKGVNIHSIKGIYKIKLSRTMIKSQQSTVKSNSLPSQNKILSELSELSDSDLSDALQHIKLAHFHGAVYQAIIESNTIVARLEKAIQSERDPS